MTTAEIWERDQTAPAGPPAKVADITEAWGRTFRHAKNDYGSCILNVQLSDTTALAAAQPGRLVKFLRDGAYHAFVLGPRRIAKVKRGEEFEQVLAIQAPGVLAVLNDGRVQPTNGEGWSPWDRQRRWDWTNPELDTTSWVAATELWRQGDVADVSASTFIQLPGDQGRHQFTIPEGYADADSQWIWSSDYLGSPGPGGTGTLHMDPGTSYFHKTFTVADDTYAKVVAACDDFFEVAIDGVVLITTAPAPEEAWSRARDRDVLLTAGTHTIRVRAENYVRGFTTGNIAALVLAVHEIAPASGTIVSTLVRTDSTWKALDYPADPPGFTAGDVQLTLLAEAQAEGFLTDVVPTFTATLDTGLNAWPLVSDIVTSVGDPLGEVVRQVCASHADVRVNHDLTFDAWVKGSAGSASGVTLAEGVNIAELEFDGDTSPVSSLLVLHRDGFLVLGDATAGRQEFLDLSQYPEPEATTRGQDALDDMTSERWAATIAVEPAGADVPLDDFAVFDTVTVPNPSGSTSLVECIAVTWSEDEAGNEILSPEVGDVVLTAGERRAQQQRTLATGLLGGRVPLPPATTPGGLASTPTGASGGQFAKITSTFEFPFHRDAAATDLVSDELPAGAARTIFEFAVHLGAAQGTDTDVTLKLNGTTVTGGTVTVPAGETYHLVGGLAIVLAKDTDLISVGCATTGFSIVAVARAR